MLKQNGNDNQNDKMKRFLKTIQAVIDVIVTYEPLWIKSDNFCSGFGSDEIFEVRTKASSSWLMRYRRCWHSTNDDTSLIKMVGVMKLQRQSESCKTLDLSMSLYLCVSLSLSTFAKGLWGRLNDNKMWRRRQPTTKWIYWAICGWKAGRQSFTKVKVESWL